jgi:hypothetical protein
MCAQFVFLVKPDDGFQIGSPRFADLEIGHDG